MSKRRKTNICSIFGLIPGVIADAMVAEGKARRIEPDDIPAMVRFDENGTRAHCALVFSPEAEREFDRRVRDLSA